MQLPEWRVSRRRTNPKGSDLIFLSSAWSITSLGSSTTDGLEVLLSGFLWVNGPPTAVRLEGGGFLVLYRCRIDAQGIEKPLEHVSGVSPGNKETYVLVINGLELSQLISNPSVLVVVFQYPDNVDSAGSCREILTC